ncbi:MAG: hypothetical protein JXA21_21490 [Anaerolineae bacterium]|nr:hypothetical protein [Anaerolineae bacterium]
MKLMIKLLLAVAVLAGLYLVGNSLWASAQAPVNVEPTSLRADLGGTISIYATAVTSPSITFTPECTVRLFNYGILTTVYVNPITLQAAVPNTLGAGDYTLNVLDANGAPIGAGTIRILAAPAPTATPKPDSPPPDGRPILTVRNFSVDPTQVRPGQEFTVNVEVYNNGSRAGENTMAVFPGGDFIPLDEEGHLFWQVPINAAFVVTQRLRVPKETSNGIHQVQVNLSANDWAGNHYDYPATIPVEVIGASTGAAPATGKPKILIEGVSTTPKVVAPDTPFTLTLRLANRGSRTATNIMTEADAATAIPAEGGSVAATDVLKINQEVTVTLQLLLKPATEGGRKGLNINLEYSDYSGGSYTDQQTVRLDVDTSLASRPQLLIQSYKTDPENISPGDTFTLTVELANVGGGEAQRLTLAFGGENGENLGAFVPVEGGNVSFVNNVASGDIEKVTMKMMAAGNAETKAHNLPIMLAYDAGTGTREKDTQRISLMVRRRPQFKISFSRPVQESMPMVGMPFPLPVELVNAGTARFNIPEMTVTGENMELNGETSSYVGNLDPGGTWEMDAMAIVMTPGTAEVVVNVSYVDDLNQTQIYSQVLTVEVMEAPQMPEFGDPMNPEGPGGGEMPETPETLPQKIWRFFKGLLGLGS